MWANMVTVSYRDAYMQEGFTFSMYMGSYMRLNELSLEYALISYYAH
jgi:hypothetical protein